MEDYDWEQLDRPKPRTSGRRWFWLLLAIVALIIFVRTSAQQRRTSEHQPLPPARAPGEPAQAERPTPSRPGDAEPNGDWSLEEMPGHQRPSTPASTASAAQTTDSNSTTSGKPTSTTEGDWTIEEVPADGKASNTPQPGATDPTPGKSAPSKTTEGDWSIEELKTAPPSNPEN
jgi:hypothetical protein